MKRKYYMRGLGIGVIVSAILFSFTGPKSASKMTDEEVIARAEALGYTKKTEGVTADDIDKIKENVSPQPGEENVTGEPEGTPGITPDATPGPTPSPVPTPEPPDKPDKPEEPDRPSSTPEPTSTPKPTSTPGPTSTPKPTNTPVPTDVPSGITYTIKVERGMTASRVSRLLEEVGAVTSATDFVTYLRDHSLTDEINIGTFQIPAGAGFKEIADILTIVR